MKATGKFFFRFSIRELLDLIAVVAPRQHFMPIGHLWWALIFDNIRGRFARFTYIRRAKESEQAFLARPVANFA
jgi:hypothetical protein